MFADGFTVTVAQAQARLYGTDKGISTLETPPCKTPVPVITRVAATTTTPTSISFGTDLHMTGEYLWDELDGLVEAKVAGGTTNPPHRRWGEHHCNEVWRAVSTPTRESAVVRAIGAADLNGITANANDNANANDTNSSNSSDNVILNNAADSDETHSATNTTAMINTNANAGAGASTTGQKADNTPIPAACHPGVCKRSSSSKTSVAT